MKSGIYKITNIINNKCYVGSAINLDARWKAHRRKLNARCHHSVRLQNAWNKDGEEKFKFDTLEKCERSILIDREQHYFGLLKPEYNICPVAGSSLGVKGQIPWNKGKRLSIEYRQLISESLKERFKNKENHPCFGKLKSDETKLKISLSKVEKYLGKGNPFYGKCHSEETKQKMSLATKGKNHPMYGKHHSEETKQKMRDAWARRKAHVDAPE